jgi:hypothetical protein
MRAVIVLAQVGAGWRRWPRRRRVRRRAPVGAGTNQRLRQVDVRCAVACAEMWLAHTLAWHVEASVWGAVDVCGSLSSTYQRRSSSASAGLMCGRYSASPSHAQGHLFTQLTQLEVATDHLINLAICRTGSAASKICRISSVGSAALMRCAVAYASRARASSPSTASKAAAT